jgi:hypothetical protein
LTEYFSEKTNRSLKYNENTTHKNSSQTGSLRFSIWRVLLKLEPAAPMTPVARGPEISMALEQP